jgi:hypothetical protein
MMPAMNTIKVADGHDAAPMFGAGIVQTSDQLHRGTGNAVGKDAELYSKRQVNRDRVVGCGFL